MDIQETWNSLLEAWDKRQWLEVIEHAEATLQWLQKDGYPPKTDSRHEVGSDWNRVVAIAAASFALKRAKHVYRSADQIPPEVPFTLCCAGCGNDGPDSYQASLQIGWTRIEHVPAALTSNFLGLCEVCRDKY